MSDELVAIDFAVPNEEYTIESMDMASVPRIGEEVVVCAKFDGSERLDSMASDIDEWSDGDFRRVLRAEVTNVIRSYFSARRRNECTVIVEVEFTKPDHGYDETGLDQ